MQSDQQQWAPQYNKNGDCAREIGRRLTCSLVEETLGTRFVYLERPLHVLDKTLRLPVIPLALWRRIVNSARHVALVFLAELQAVRRVNVNMP